MTVDTLWMISDASLIDITMKDYTRIFTTYICIRYVLLQIEIMVMCPPVMVPAQPIVQAIVVPHARMNVLEHVKALVVTIVRVAVKKVALQDVKQHVKVSVKANAHKHVQTLAKPRLHNTVLTAQVIVHQDALLPALMLVRLKLRKAVLIVQTIQQEVVVRDVEVDVLPAANKIVKVAV